LVVMLRDVFCQRQFWSPESSLAFHPGWTAGAFACPFGPSSVAYPEFNALSQEFLWISELFFFSVLDSLWYFDWYCESCLWTFLLGRLEVLFEYLFPSWVLDLQNRCNAPICRFSQDLFPIIEIFFKGFPKCTHKIVFHLLLPDWDTFRVFARKLFPCSSSRFWVQSYSFFFLGRLPNPLWPKRWHFISLLPFLLSMGFDL